MSGRIEHFTGDYDMERLMQVLGQHLEAKVLAVVVQKANGHLALVAPSGLEFRERLADCVQRIAEELE